MTDTFITTTKPCPAEGCVNGTRVYAVRSYGGRWTDEEEIRDCETCGGNEVITVEVHEACGFDEARCPCFLEKAQRRRLRQVLTAMRQRCHNPRNKNYRNYGGRGIAVCDRWRVGRAGFENFLADMGNRPSPDLEIDRINNNGNYEPSNCRWATRKQQLRNMRTNVYLAVNGEMQLRAELVERSDICLGTVRHRIDLGWTAEKALLTPPMLKKRLSQPERELLFELAVAGQTPEQLGQHFGIHPMTVPRLIRNEAPPEVASKYLKLAEARRLRNMAEAKRRRSA